MNQNMTKITKGLPKEKRNEKPLLQQYLYKNNNNFSVSLIYNDGAIFNTVKVAADNYKWIYFTSLKFEGIQQLKKILENDFIHIASHEEAFINQDFIVWIFNSDTKQHKVKVETGLYSGLPEIFKNVEDIINNNLVPLKDSNK